MSFYRVAFLITFCRCSDHIHYRPPSIPFCRPLTATAISSPQGGSYGVSAGWTRIGIGAPSVGRCLYSYSLVAELFYSSSLVGCGGLSLACQYHLCIFPQVSLLYTAARRASIFAPVIPTLHLMSSCRASWKRLFVIRKACCSDRCFRHKAIPWSFRLQVASYIYYFLAWISHGGFLTSFRRSAKTTPYSRIGTIFVSVMGQVGLLLWYLIFRLSMLPLILASIIWWSVETLGSLMLRF